MNAQTTAENILPPFEWSDLFLDWFSRQGNPMHERRLKLGSFDYFHFSSRCDVSDGRVASSFGSSPSRKVAAIKCAAEAIERVTMVRFFSNQNSAVPKAFRNSNGWAVHQTRDQAIEKAKAEAIERHLLLLTFFKFGWSGFSKVQTIEAPGMTINFYQTPFACDGRRAGIAVAQADLYRGVSFGHCLLARENGQSSEAWQSALFEAVDKFLVLDGKLPSAPQESWITKETNRFLTEPFDVKVFGNRTLSLPVESKIGDIAIDVIDLKEELKLDFPLFTAFARGGGLIPLFAKSELDRESFKHVRSILEKHRISEIPERHPIL